MCLEKFETPLPYFTLKISLMSLSYNHLIYSEDVFKLFIVNLASLVLVPVLKYAH